MYTSSFFFKLCNTDTGSSNRNDLNFSVSIYPRSNLLAIGSPQYTVSASLPSAGRVTILDAATGAEVAVIDGAEDFGQFGYSVAAGDLTVDGNAEFRDVPERKPETGFRRKNVSKN